MKAIKTLSLAAIAITAISACNSEDESTWKQYTEWREANVAWVKTMSQQTDDNGKALYTRIAPPYDSEAYIYMRWFNDTTKTSQNLVPLYNSTVDVKYYGQLYNDEPFDSSYVSISPADSVCRFQVNDRIPGWTTALQQMHVGDSVEVIIPWKQAYGASSSGIILPYSALRFQIKLTNVAGEYIRP